MGRPAKALEEHALAGTKSVAANAVRDSHVPAGRPKFPTDLTPETKPIFKRMCKLLEQRRALTAGDADVLRAYAIVYDRHRRAMEHVRAEGEICTYFSLDKDGVQVPRVKPNLWLKVAQESERQMVAYLDRLGLTSLNRDKVKPTRATPEETAADTPGTVMYLLKHGRGDEETN
jgi:P27 family predicted phage terminase small subunit